MQYAIQTEQLTKKYTKNADPPAVNGLDLDIQQGILYGLVGPDGAGKTTTLRMISTVMRASSGTVKVLGYDVRRQPDRIRERIGYMPQNFSLYPDLSVEENLHFFADIQHVPADRKKQRIAEMLRFTRLEEFRDRKAGKLSGGMKKKLALASALMHEPQLLVLDEPSTGVDPVSRRELWVILAEVVQNGVTVIVSTPYMDEAERCHQVGILSQGQILASGTPESLKNSLPFEILEVKARPRKKMREIVSTTPGILDWRPVGDTLRLTVPNGGSSNGVMHSLDSRLRAEQMDVRLLRQSRRTMEDVFVHLVNTQRAAS